MPRPSWVRRQVIESNLHPSDISGLSAWYRTDTGLTLDGNKVVGWEPVLKRGVSLAQATDALRPTIATTTSPTTTAAPAIRQVSSQYLAGNNTVTSAVGRSWTVFVVVRPEASSSYCNIYDDSSGSGPMLWKNTVNRLEFNTTLYSWSVTATLPLWMQVPTVIVSVNNCANSGQPWEASNRVFINSRVHANTTGDPTLVPPAAKTFTIAHRLGGISPLIGDIYEALIFDRRLGDHEVHQVNRYLMKRYGRFQV